MTIKNGHFVWPFFLGGFIPKQNKEFDDDGKGNYGPGGFGDQYDNQRFRSLDDGGNPGGVTGIQFEDNFSASEFGEDKKGEAYYYPGKRTEPRRDADLGMGSSGTNWNRPTTNYRGMGPRGWELSDEKLRERVSDVLMHSHEVDPSELDVIVKEKVVYLEGKIKSKGMRTIAEDLVLSIPGVEDVFTTLEISDTSNFQFKTE